MRVLGISGTIIGKKSRILLDQILQNLKQIDPSIHLDVLDLKTYTIPFCDGRDPDSYEGELKQAIDMVKFADIYVIVTPIFHCPIPGSLKNLIDFIPIHVMEKKIVALAVAGGKEEHYLVPEHQLKPIFNYAGAYVLPEYVYSIREQFLGEEMGNDLQVQNQKFAENIWTAQKIVASV